MMNNMNKKHLEKKKKKRERERKKSISKSNSTPKHNKENPFMFSKTTKRAFMSVTKETNY